MCLVSQSPEAISAFQLEGVQTEGPIDSSALRRLAAAHSHGETLYQIPQRQVFLPLSSRLAGFSGGSPEFTDEETEALRSRCTARKSIYQNYQKSRFQSPNPYLTKTGQELRLIPKPHNLPSYPGTSLALVVCLGKKN